MNSDQSATPVGSCDSKRSAMRMTSLSSVATTAARSSGSRLHQVHYVTEAQSVLPCLSSAFSLEGMDWGQEVTVADPPSQSVQGLESGLDIYDDPDYVDTVRSCDSAGSLLRRSLSVPAPQHPTRTHVADIFSNYPLDWHSRDPKTAPLSPLRETMTDLLVQPGYVDVLPAGAAASTPDDEPHPNYMRNLLVLSVSFMAVFAAYLSLRNLQSSLNGSVGLAALSVVYLCLCLGCVISPTVVQRLRPKRTMLAAMTGLLLYVLANLRPAAWSLLPASAVAGVSLACLWTAHATYMTSIALSHAAASGRSPQRVLTRFNGIFFAFFQTAQILGGLLSSLVLSPGTVAPVDDDNTTAAHNATAESPHQVAPLCGAGYAAVTAVQSVTLSTAVTFAMIGLFSVLLVAGLFVLLFQLQPIDGAISRPHASIASQLLATFRFFVDVRVVCLFPLMCYSFLEMSFMVGEYTKSFVTCAVGVEMVGYVMLSQSACSAASSFLNDKLQKHIGRVAIFIVAAVINVGLLLTMLLWQPTVRTFAVLFVVAGGWGVADGLLMTQLVSFFGFLFSENREAAFAGLKMCQSAAAMVFYLISPYVSTTFKILFLLLVLLVAMTGYLVLEFMLRRRKRLNATTGETRKTPAAV